MKMKDNVAWYWHLAAHLLIVGVGVLCLATDAFMTEKEIMATASPVLTMAVHGLVAVFYFGYVVLHMVFLMGSIGDGIDDALFFVGCFFEMLVMWAVHKIGNIAGRVKKLFVEETK